jgi:hypothetical protein
MPRTRTGERTARLSTRVEPRLVEAVGDLAKANGETHGEMVRLLVRRGIKGVQEDAGRPISPHLPSQDVMRAQMEGVNAVLSLVAERDPREAIRLAMDSAIFFSRWAEAEAKEQGTTTAEVYNGSAGTLS